MNGWNRRNYHFPTAPLATDITSDAELEACLQNRLLACYSAGIPDFAQARLRQELAHMELTQSGEAILLCRELARAADRSGHILHTDGASVGSLLVFLLTSGSINPLPTHYYCPACGEYEIASGVTFGLDLAEKPCPCCHAPMRREGFSIPPETVWRSSGKKPLPLEYRFSKGFFPFALRAIQAFYAGKNRAVIPQGAIRSDGTRLLEPVGASILPEGHTAADYPQFTAYLADGTLCFAGDRHEMKRCGIQRIVLTEHRIATALYTAQANCGIWAADIPHEVLIGTNCRDLTNTAFVSAEECIALQTGAPSYYEMACALTLPHNSYEDRGEQIPALQVLDLPEFKTCPLYCREDIFERMLAANSGRDPAARAAEAIGFGKATYRPALLDELNLPEDIAAAARHCLYLFPRGSGAQRLVSLLVLAGYMKADPKSYFEMAAAMQT